MLGTARRSGPAQDFQEIDRNLRRGRFPHDRCRNEQDDKIIPAGKGNGFPLSKKLLIHITLSLEDSGCWQNVPCHAAGAFFLSGSAMRETGGPRRHTFPPRPAAETPGRPEPQRLPNTRKNPLFSQSVVST